MVPENRTGSCGMMVMRDRSLVSPSSPMFSPSMWMAPPADSMMRKSASVSEDFPAPVLHKSSIPRLRYLTEIGSRNLGIKLVPNTVE